MQHDDHALLLCFRQGVEAQSAIYLVHLQSYQRQLPKREQLFL